MLKNFDAEPNSGLLREIFATYILCKFTLQDQGSHHFQSHENLCPVNNVFEAMLH